jgi:hypothetical protein
MYTCDYWRNALWDDLFDLLDAGERERLREHLTTCSVCQVERAKAEARKKRLAQAALLDVEVPPFIAPDPAGKTAVHSEVETLPFTTESPPGREARSFRLWPWLAAAAALLLSVGLPYGLYKEGLARREAVLQEARERYAEVSDQQQRARQQAALDERNLEIATRAHFIRVQVLGPTRYQPGTPNQWRVITADLNGSFAPARVTALLRDEKRGDLFKKDFTSQGDLLLTLPPDLPVEPGAAPVLEVMARTQEEQEQVRESLSVSSPTYVTHLSLDKPSYQPGDVLRFRSLTLERFRFKPPTSEFTITYQITDASGKECYRRTGKILQEGFGGGEVEVTWPAGEYKLTATEAKQRFPAVAHKFLVRSQQAPLFHTRLTFDRPAYNPGDRVHVDIRLGRRDNKPVGQQLLTIRAEINEKLVSPTKQIPTDDEGRAAFDVSLPADLPEGLIRLFLDIRDPKTTDPPEKLVRIIPRTPRKLAVEFFPEGGDLVAEIPNRVYFRVRSPWGQPVDLAGEIVDSQRRRVAEVRTIHDSKQPALGRGLGLFTFTPKAGERYTLRITAPAGIETQPELPEVQPRGVALSVAQGVVEEGKSLSVILQNADTERRMLLGLFNHGRLVSLQPLVVTPGRQEITLAPVPGCRGAARVTLFDLVRGQLQPVAERLVYFVPANRLALALQFDKERYQPGDPVKVTVRSQNENGQPEPAQLLVSVVNQAALSVVENPTEATLPSYFYLLSDLQRPEDLEDADLLLTNDPQAPAALDLVLGTQGWRRFVKPEAAALLAKKDAVLDHSDTLLNLDNATSVGEKYRAAFSPKRNELKDRFAIQEKEFEGKISQQAEVARAAVADLNAYEARVAGYLRRGLGLGSVALLASGSVLLGIALLRKVRRHVAATPYLRSAFATLLPCFLMVLGLVNQPAVSIWSTDLPDLIHTTRIPESQNTKNTARAPLLTAADFNMPLSKTLVLQRGGEIGGEQPGLLRYHNVAEGGQLKPGPNLLPIRRPGEPQKEKDERPFTVRVYAYLHAAEKKDIEPPETIFWHPLLPAGSGTAEVTFDLPFKPASYRIRIEGNSSSGRLGAVQKNFEARP